MFTKPNRGLGIRGWGSSRLGDPGPAKQTKSAPPSQLSETQELIYNPGQLGRMQTVFARKNGTVIGVNRKRIYEHPFFLNSNPPFNSVTMTASGSSNPIAMRVSAEGPMQLTMLGVKRTGACQVVLTIQDGTGSRDLMNGPVHVDTILGTGGQMYPLPEALYIDENRALNATFTDLSAAPNAARITAVASKYNQLQQDPTLDRIRQRIQSRQYMSMPFWYTFEDASVVLTGLGTSSEEIVLKGDEHFEIHQISSVSTGSFVFDIVDLTKGESIISAPSNTHYAVPNGLISGTNSFPYRFSEPIFVFAGQRLLVTLQDTSGASNTVFITLGGRLISPRMWS